MQPISQQILEENQLLRDALLKSQQTFSKKLASLLENLVETRFPQLKLAFERETNEILEKHARKIENIAGLPQKSLFSQPAAAFSKDLNPNSEFFEQNSLNFLENNENFLRKPLENSSQSREMALRKRLEKLKKIDTSSSSSLSSSSESFSESSKSSKDRKKMRKIKEKSKKKAKLAKKVKKIRMDSSFSRSSG